MDREFIEKNQIVERYLTGKLPPKGVSDFERVVRTNPQLIEELGFADRVHAAVRLLEASGQPEPWQEKSRAFWEKPSFIGAAAALAAVFLIVSVVLFFQLRDARGEVAALQKEVIERPIDPTTRGRPINVIPSRAGPVRDAMFRAGGDMAELIEMRIDLSWASQNTFRARLDRDDQGGVMVLHNVLKDSNGNLRLSLNSSALGPGEYTMAIEGLNWKGQPTPTAWIRFAIDPR